MPDAGLLNEMYGPRYLESFATALAEGEVQDRSRPTAFLRREHRGRFIDYGCGDGGLLRDAAALGWETVGIEFDDEVAARVSARTGLRVIAQRAAPAEPPADVVHVGDVLEHLTEINRQLPAILGLVKPGGVLLAEGPLEAHASVFTWILRLARLVRRTPGSMPPYHVILATAAGQRRLFERHDLRSMEFRVHEVAWPAPSRLGLADLTRPRAVALYAIRRVSQAISRLTGGRWGNRYFYAGRREA